MKKISDRVKFYNQTRDLNQLVSMVRIKQVEENSKAMRRSILGKWLLAVYCE